MQSLSASAAALVLAAAALYLLHDLLRRLHAACCDGAAAAGPQRPLRCLVVGCGAAGSVLGYHICRGGAHVGFLVSPRSAGRRELESIQLKHLSLWVAGGGEAGGLRKQVEWMGLNIYHTAAEAVLGSNKLLSPDPAGRAAAAAAAGEDEPLGAAGKHGWDAVVLAAPAAALQVATSLKTLLLIHLSTPRFKRGSSRCSRSPPSSPSSSARCPRRSRSCTSPPVRRWRRRL